MWTKWVPRRTMLRLSPRRYGFQGAFLLMSRAQRFSQPAAVLAPTELLRSGAILHARGLMNSQAIQHNMDWVWPHWVVRQFNPNDESFVPRAFSVAHINVTNRNWTAVGLPDFEEFPIVDPRGMLTPLLDGWSLDAWLIGPDGQALLPSRAPWVRQELVWDSGLAVATEVAGEWGTLRLRAEVAAEEGTAVCRFSVNAVADRKAWLALALRPVNPEGVSFIHDLELLPGRTGWKINRKEEVHFDTVPDAHALSIYKLGDVYQLLPMDDPESKVRCEVGMATAAALYDLEPDKHRVVSAGIPLGALKKTTSWSQAVTEGGSIRVPDAHVQYIYDAAVRSLILHSPGVIYPGPYTYRRFWFRDAAYIIRALLCLGQAERAERALDLFPSKQTPFGHFLSQDGEWDSNGQAIWAMRQFCLLTGRPVKAAWWPSIYRGARWIQRLRVKKGRDGMPHEGLLPAGFSAEHLGPNDHYYWDNFWSVAGLHAAADLAAALGETPAAVGDF